MARCRRSVIKAPAQGGERRFFTLIGAPLVPSRGPVYYIQSAAAAKIVVPLPALELQR
jgi:hypothetical protein